MMKSGSKLSSVPFLRCASSSDVHLIALSTKSLVRANLHDSRQRFISDEYVSTKNFTLSARRGWLLSYSHSSRLVATPSEYNLKMARSFAAVFAALVSLLASGNNVSKSLLVRFTQLCALSGCTSSKPKLRAVLLARKLIFSSAVSISGRRR